MSAFIRNLNFSWLDIMMVEHAHSTVSPLCSSVDLKKEVTFLWTFDDIASNPKLYVDQFPVVWKCVFSGNLRQEFR